MSDIFLSYAREDRSIAAALAAMLPAHNWTVFWDRHILAGSVFDEVIERELDAARCVIALWSAASVASQWVRAEAEEGAQRNVLVAVLIEYVKPPIAFRRIQAADLTGWAGDPQDERLWGLWEAVAFLLKEPAPEPAAARQWDTAVLRTIQDCLAPFVGPIAPVLVRTAAGRAAGPFTSRALCEALALEIPAPADRARFLAACDSRLHGFPAGRPPEFVTSLIRDLSVYLGPITDVLVNRALAKAASHGELYEMLSREISSEAGRQAFLKSRGR
jgi:hypothetical protein